MQRPFTVCKISGGTANIRVANVSRFLATMKKGQVIARVYPTVSVVNRVRSGGSGGKELISQVKVGEDFSSRQKSEMNALLNDLQASVLQWGRATHSQGRN